MMEEANDAKPPPEDVGEEETKLFRLLTPDSSASSSSQEQNVPKEEWREGKTLGAKELKEVGGLACQPLEEIDAAYNSTFIAIGKGGTIHRMPLEKSLGLLPPLNPIRKAAIFLNTHYAFSAFMVLVVLINVIVLHNTEDRVVDWICIAVYIFEFGLKIISRGLIKGEFTSLRNLWNWLDVVVILSAVLEPLLLRFLVLRWLRILKVIPLVKVMRIEHENLTIHVRRLLPTILAVGVVSLSLLSIFGLQIYMGVLTNKCIENMEGPVSEEEWNKHGRDSNNWYWPNFPESLEPMLCGNASGTGHCPANFTCQQGFGPNPNDGYTNFDTFGWSFIQTWRITSQDVLEELYVLLSSTAATWSTLPFFVLCFFLGTYLIGVATYGILARSLLDLEEEKQDEEGQDHNEVPEVLTTTNEDNAELGKLRQFCKKIADKFGFEVFITVVILLDTLMSMLNIYLLGNPRNYDPRYVIRPNEKIVPLIYLAECLIKIIAKGGIPSYFKEGWNIFDFVVLLGLITNQLLLISGLGSILFVQLLANMRYFKIIPRWNGLHHIVLVSINWIRNNSGLIGNIAVALILLAFLGKEFFKDAYEENVSLFRPENIPRWNFSTFMSSFLPGLCAWGKSSSDVLNPCMLVAGRLCIPYFGMIQILVLLFLSVLIVQIAIITTTSSSLYPKGESTLTKIWERVTHPISKAIRRKKGQADSDKANGTDEAETLPMTDSEANGGQETSKSKADGENQRNNDDSGIHDEEANADKTAASGSLAGTKKAVKIQEWLTRLSVVVILVSSCLMSWDESPFRADYEGGQTVATKIVFWSDIVFLLVVGTSIIYSVVVAKSKGSIKAVAAGLAFDTIIIVGCILDLVFYIQGRMVYALTLFKFIRSLRPFMLVSRLQRLKSIGLTLWNQVSVGGLFSALLGMSFIWTVSSIIFAKAFDNAFHLCIEPLGENAEEVKYTYDLDDCSRSNRTWDNPKLSFTTPITSLMTTVLIATGSGWLAVLRDMLDYSGDFARHPIKDGNMEVGVTLFLGFYIFGVILPIAVVIGTVFKHLKESKEMIFSKDDYNQYLKLKSPSLTESVDQPAAPSTCREKLRRFVTSDLFEGISLVFVIIFAVAAAYDHYMMSDAAGIILNIIHVVIILELTIEVILKLTGLGCKEYFCSFFNWIEFLAVLLGVPGLVISDLIDKYFISAVVFLIPRILKLLFFRPLLSQFRELDALIKSVKLVKWPIFSIIFYNILFMFSYSLFGAWTFNRVKGDDPTDPWFTTWSSSFSKTFLLSTLSGVGEIFFHIGKEYYCESEIGLYPGDCGHYGYAVFFILTYLIGSFIINVNLYGVLIVEYLSQLTILKNSRDESA